MFGIYFYQFCIAPHSLPAEPFLHLFDSGLLFERLYMNQVKILAEYELLIAGIKFWTQAWYTAVCLVQRAQLWPMI